MPQAVDCELLTVDCLIFQHKDTTEIQTVLSKNFRMLFDWFVDNKTKKNCLAANIKLRIQNH